MSDELLPYAPLILKLLQGVIYYDDKLWEQLISYAAPIHLHFASSIKDFPKKAVKSGLPRQIHVGRSDSVIPHPST